MPILFALVSVKKVERLLLALVKIHLKWKLKKWKVFSRCFAAFYPMNLGWGTIKSNYH